MSHCISVLLLRKIDVQNELKNMSYADLEGGIIAVEKSYGTFLRTTNIKYLDICTDYFGGVGEQSCEIFIPELNIGKRYPDIEMLECDSINDGLRRLGIIKNSDQDEFDNVGLGNYRGNNDFKFKKDMGPKEDLKMSFFDWIRKIKSTHFKNN